ncbi:MAG: outer membrane protein assembly factor BamB [Gammaproteobacteria bacterium]|nr:MAG: outer membrane protein assembly factor BamB [Gammaproteobacteria bacterium]
MKNIRACLTLLTFSLLLTACGFFDKDNTPEPKPLVQFKPEIKPHRLWSTHAGASIGDDYLKLTPSTSETAIFTASTNGVVTSVNKANGQRNWQVDTRLPLTTGPGAGDGLVVVASRRGDVEALRQADGAMVWKASIPGEILAKPAIGQDVVIVKAIDGNIHALAVQDGHERWATQQVEPSLILRGSSTPIISDHSVIVGFANGSLSRLALSDGEAQWTQAIAIPEGAFAIQRMIDIDADPLVLDHRIYAATYQGKISSLAWGTGQPLWSHDISSYTGMTADEETVYITDAKSYVWAFDAESGSVDWRQEQLEARIVTAPAAMGRYVVVGDAQGYIHWLDKKDGHFAAREYVGAMYAAPIVDNNVLYLFTNKGELIAYTL